MPVRERNFSPEDIKEWQLGPYGGLGLLNRVGGPSVRLWVRRSALTAPSGRNSISLGQCSGVGRPDRVDMGIPD